MAKARFGEAPPYGRLCDVFRALAIGEAGDFSQAEQTLVGGDEGEAKDFCGGCEKAVGGIGVVEHERYCTAATSRAA